MDNHDIIEALRRGDSKVYEKLFIEYFGMVKYLVENNQGTEEDARDVFQDTILVLINKSRQANFTLKASIKTFIYSVARNIWYSRARKRKGLKTITDFEDYLESDETSVERKKAHDERLNKLEKQLAGMGDPCRTLLQQFYYLKQSMTEIAKNLGYTNANHAKSQKYKCMKKLKSMMLSES